jgi:pimeloyl-ACP methyl ester carboxylesterase
MVTSGGWAYCYQVRKLASRSGLTLICGRYYKDGYVGFGLRAKRHEDWGDPAYLASLAAKIRALHERVGGELILIGVSYSGFGVATLASHHPELRPDRLIVIDSYLDLVARRARIPDSHQTAQEIDLETGGSRAALRARSVSDLGLARLVRSGTKLTAIWSVSDAERVRYRGATCDRTANAGTLSQLAGALGRPVHAWVTSSRHGTTLWHFGPRLLEGRNPGREVVFRPDGVIPDAAVC